MNREPKQQQIDSKTSDVSEEIRVSVHDDRLTVRINRGLKEAIKRHCLAKGLSICHINDALWLGYLRGFYDKIDLDVKSPTIGLTVVRDVKRVRRYAVQGFDTCGFRGCRRAAVGSGVWRGKDRVLLCERHFVEAKAKPEDWSEVESG
jgi:hypothetical protein